MKYKIENDFNKHVKSEQAHSVYLLHGSQVYLIELYEKALLKKVLKGEYNDFNLHRFSTANLDLQAFYDAVESLPFFADHRCVTLDLAPDKLDTGSLKELCGVLEDVPNTTTVIVTVKEPPGKKEKLNALVKACDKSGAVVELGARTNSDLLRFLRNYAQKNGCEMSSDTASYLVRRCGDDIQQLSSEMQKICAYQGAGEISRETVDEIAVAVLSAKVYDLSKAILRGNYDKAMELIDHLLYLREPAAKVLAVLSGAFVDLYRGFCARQASVGAAQAAVDLGYAKNREFVLKNAMSDSGSYTPVQMGNMLNILAQADMALKSTGADDRVILEQAVVKLFMA